MQKGEYEGAPYLYLPAKDAALLWFAHIDTVLGSDDQFTVKVEDGKAWGRGAKDIKGALVTFLTAYRDFCAEGNNPPVSILLTSDEEMGGHTIPALLDQGFLKGKFFECP